MTRSRQNAPTQRQMRVGEEIRHILAKVIFQSCDIDAKINKSQITLTQVSVGPDLKNAKIYITTHLNCNKKEIISSLNKLAYAFQAEIARELPLKFSPKLKFFYDETLEKALYIDSLLKSSHVSQDLS